MAGYSYYNLGFGDWDETERRIDNSIVSNNQDAERMLATVDGNGCMGRFLMNAMLASGEYPGTVIPVEDREKYMQALERASIGQDIEPFARFLGYL